MEHIAEIAKRQQVGNSLPQLSTQQCRNEISLYTGELTKPVLTKTIAKAKAAFPALTPEFFVILIERLRDKGFSDQRLIDAVNNVIDNCQYPTPTMANFLSYDKRVKIYTYSEAISNITPGKDMSDIYSKIIFNGKPAWVRKDEKELYKLPDII